MTALLTHPAWFFLSIVSICISVIILFWKRNINIKYKDIELNTNKGVNNYRRKSDVIPISEHILQIQKLTKSYDDIIENKCHIIMEQFICQYHFFLRCEAWVYNLMEELIKDKLKLNGRSTKNVRLTYYYLYMYWIIKQTWDIDHNNTIRLLDNNLSDISPDVWERFKKAYIDVYLLNQETVIRNHYNNEFFDIMTLEEILEIWSKENVVYEKKLNELIEELRKISQKYNDKIIEKYLVIDEIRGCYDSTGNI